METSRSVGTRGLAALVAFGFFPQLLSAAPDIALQMNVEVAVPAVGPPVEFTVKASNVGDAAAAGVVVSDKLPAELAQVYAVLGDLPRAQKNHRHVICVQRAQGIVCINVNFLKHGTKLR